jgi:DNA-binding NtrC family response regulator
MAASPFVILYVEDNDLIRESFAEVLETAERRVVSVPDGAGARAALREHTVDLLMTDVHLPDGSGIDVAREALLQNPRLPVIVCSGGDVSEAARLLGPTAHPLSKPVDLHELLRLVDRLAR